MCIIAVKPRGVEPCSIDSIREMFKNNSDGAGFMYRTPTGVRVMKGYMKVNEFIDAITPFLKKEHELVMHFRIGTGGGNIPKNTHPFAVSNKDEYIESTNIHCPIAMVHNGIISLTSGQSKIQSDTMVYVKDYLSTMYDYDNKFFLKKFQQQVLFCQCILPYYRLVRLR